MKIFRKIATILGSALMIGSTMGMAAAANFPAPFVSGGVADVAVVYGSDAALSDSVAAANIQSKLASTLTAQTATSTTSVSVSGGVVEDEVILGATIEVGKLAVTSLTDNKVPALLDSVFSWDNGSGGVDYHMHEEIVITDTKMKILTTLDDNDFTGAALSNDKGIMYKYVIEDVMDVTSVGGTTADKLYLTILGKEYEISDMTASTITVVTSTEISLGKGESYTWDGVTLTVEDIFSGSVQVNGEVITSGNTKKISGVRVNVDTIGYHTNAPETSKTILKIGEDISKTFTSGEEYVGEDEDDPLWVWDFTDGFGGANDYIGVKYNQKITRAKDDKAGDSIKYVGESYVLPESYAEVKFVGLTDVDYEDFEISFIEKEDLWDNTQKTSTGNQTDKPILVIEAVDGSKDAIKTTGGKETNKIYLYWAQDNASVVQGATDWGAIEVLYSDVNSDVSDVIRPRWDANYNGSAAATVDYVQVAELLVGDTVVNVDIQVDTGRLILGLVDEGTGAGINTTIKIGGEVLATTTGKLEWFGGATEATSKDTAEADEITVTASTIGTKDYDVMTYYGLIIKEPETNLDDDLIVVSVPKDHVYAIVSVLGAGGTATTTTSAGTELGSVTVSDTEIDSVSGKNLIVVGGSCINSVAAELLGSDVAVCGADFTALTGVAAGEFLLESFDRSGKVAMLVAGYHAADTTKAATYLVNNVVDSSVGKKYKGTSATEASLVVAAE